MTKLRITATFEYEPRPDDYPTDDPQEMLNIDLDNLTAVPGRFVDFVGADDVTFTGEVVK